MIQPTSTWAAQRALPPEGRLIPRVAVGLLILFPIGGLLPVPPTFKDRTQETGLNARLFSGSPSKKYILESMSGGVGLVDFNRDGWIDIYLVNGSSLEAEGGGGGGEPGSESALPQQRQRYLPRRDTEGRGGRPRLGHGGLCRRCEQRWLGRSLRHQLRAQCLVRQSRGRHFPKRQPGIGDGPRLLELFCRPRRLRS